MRKLLLLDILYICVRIELCLTYEGSLYIQRLFLISSDFSLFFGLVCLLNKSSSSHFFALFSHLLHISTICSILVKLNWSQSIGTEIRKRHLNGIMTAHDIFFDCSCKNFNRMSFPLWFMECFPFCLLLFMLKIFFETVSVFGSFLSQLLLLPSYV